MAPQHGKVNLPPPVRILLAYSNVFRRLRRSLSHSRSDLSHHHLAVVVGESLITCDRSLGRGWRRPALEQWHSRRQGANRRTYRMRAHYTLRTVWHTSTVSLSTATAPRATFLRTRARARVRQHLRRPLLRRTGGDESTQPKLVTGDT